MDDILIIGAETMGMAAHLIAAQRFRRITILEKTERVGYTLSPSAGHLRGVIIQRPMILQQ